MKTIKALLILVIAACFTLPATFLWNMGRPLANPDFKGLSYFEYLEWHKLATQESIQQYSASHPDFVYTGIGSPLTACHTSRVLITGLIGPLQSIGYAAASLAGVKGDDVHPLPKEVTIWNLPQKSWDTFEYLFWYNEIQLRGYESPVAFCRIPASIPTPLELQELESQPSLY